MTDYFWIINQILLLITISSSSFFFFLANLLHFLYEGYKLKKKKWGFTVYILRDETLEQTQITSVTINLCPIIDYLSFPIISTISGFFFMYFFWVSISVTISTYSIVSLWMILFLQDYGVESMTSKNISMIYCFYFYQNIVDGNWPS